MRISKGALALVSVGVGLILLGLAANQSTAQSYTEEEYDIAPIWRMSDMFSGAGTGLSEADLISVLEGAAATGQPLALWRLGVMYENGEGVAKDPVRAFAYFSRIANEHADTPPRALEADIVAQSFVKVGDYYRAGLPGAGIARDVPRSRTLIMHAATYFGNATAQYRVGLWYLDGGELGYNPIQGARWLTLAARKGHVAAQARLGDLLFRGNGIGAQPVEGLMWLTLARERTKGTSDDPWVAELLDAAAAIATPEQIATAASLAAHFGEDSDGV